MRNKKPALLSIGIDSNCKVIENWKNNNINICNLIHGKAELFLMNYKFKGCEVVYLDPPYLSSARRRNKVYADDYTVDDHVNLLKIITSIKCNVLISGYDSKLYNKYLSSWSKIVFNSMSHIGIRQECVWFNYEKPRKLHDGTYIGKNFRERELIKKRINRLKDKILKMEEMERNVFIEWINKKFIQQEKK